MKIQSITNTNFSSLKYPIKPFKLNTSKGCVSCCEIDYLKSIDSKNLKQLGEFFLDNFAASSSHPFWKLCQKKNKFFNKHVYNDYLRNDICKKIKNNLINPDSTIMIGKNNKNEIVAAIVTTPFEHKENSLYNQTSSISDYDYLNQIDGISNINELEQLQQLEEIDQVEMKEESVASQNSVLSSPMNQMN